MHVATGARKSDINSHDMQIIKYWSFCDRTQTSNTGVSAYIRRIILILTKFAYFGVSADVRRKTPRHYYGFAHMRTLKGLGVSTDTRRYSSCLNNFKYHKCVHHAQIIQYWSFCDRTQTLRIWMKYYLNDFKFSKSKTQCVHFCQLRKVHTDPELYLYGTLIPVVDEAKFLGVIFDRKLSFILHINT